MFTKIFSRFSYEAQWHLYLSIGATHGIVVIVNILFTTSVLATLLCVKHLFILFSLKVMV